MQTVLITGGNGMIGKAITAQLIDKGYQVIVLTRQLPKKENSASNVFYALWNVKERSIDIAAIQKADYIIHLAGAGVVDKNGLKLIKKRSGIAVQKAVNCLLIL